MAVPTITGVSPDSGSTRGQNMINIIGTNFNIPGPPPVSGPVQSEQPKTVSVQFEGVESEWAYCASDTRILARVPEWRGGYDSFPLALDVRVANLDASGVEIPGENVTAADAYTINQKVLAEESYLQHVIRQLIELYRRHVTPNVHHTTSRDYSLNPTSQETLDLEGAVVGLHGPSMPINRFYALNREEPEDNPNEPPYGFTRKKPPVTVNLEFGVSVWVNNPYHLYGLCQSILMLHRDILFLRVDNDPKDPSKGYVEYELAMPWNGFPEADSAPNFSDLNSATAQCHVRGVNIDDVDGTIVERGWKVYQNDGLPVIEPESM